MNCKCHLCKAKVENPYWLSDLKFCQNCYEAITKGDIQGLIKNQKDYRAMSKGFIGETIKDFFCNGFFGSRNYDLEGAKIINIYQEDETIVIKVMKSDNKYDYGYFEDDWADWECVHSYLKEWVNGVSE